MMKYTLAAALLAVTTSAHAGDKVYEAHKEQFCNVATPAVAVAAYCSIWRAKCGLQPRYETKDEIIDRLLETQQIDPFLTIEDVQYLVESAMGYKEGDKNAFARKQIADCQISYDLAEQSRRKKSVTDPSPSTHDEGDPGDKPRVQLPSKMDGTPWTPPPPPLTFDAPPQSNHGPWKTLDGK